MSRAVVPLLTINQWAQLDPAVRAVILQNIRLKDRLQRFLVANQTKPELPPEGKWVPCKRCGMKGYVLKTPRHPGIHPSQIPNECLLRTYWQMLGKEERTEHNARTLVTFDIGHAVHDMLQNYGKAGAWGQYYKPEEKITDGSHPLATELFIEGHVDADNVLVIDDIPNAPIYELGIVHEYKTINSAGFAKLTRPKPAHKQQAIIYSAILDRPVVVYLYVCKDDSSMADFPVEFDPAAWDLIHTKIRTLIQHYDNAIEPPAKPVAYSCRECPFFYCCEAGQNSQRTGSRRG